MTNKPESEYVPNGDSRPILDDVGAITAVHRSMKQMLEVIEIFKPYMSNTQTGMASLHFEKWDQALKGLEDMVERVPDCPDNSDVDVLKLRDIYFGQILNDALRGWDE